YENERDHRQHDEREESPRPVAPAAVGHLPFVVITGGACLSHTNRCRKSLLRLKMSIQRLGISDSWTSSGMTVSSKYTPRARSRSTSPTICAKSTLRSSSPCSRNTGDFQPFMAPTADDLNARLVVSWALP